MKTTVDTHKFFSEVLVFRCVGLDVKGTCTLGSYPRATHAAKNVPQFHLLKTFICLSSVNVGAVVTHSFGLHPANKPTPLLERNQSVTQVTKINSP